MRIMRDRGRERESEREKKKRLKKKKGTVLKGKSGWRKKAKSDRRLLILSLHPCQFTIPYFSLKFNFQALSCS